MQTIEVKRILVSILALINEENEILICKRGKGKYYPFFWEFPGGKVEKNETPESALIREIREEIGVDIEASCIAPVTFSSTKNKNENLIIFLFVARRWFHNPILKVHIEFKWVNINMLRNYKMPPPNRCLISYLQDLIL